MLRNKILAIGLVFLGIISVSVCDNDATVLLFTLVMALPMFFAKYNIFDDSDKEYKDAGWEELDYGKSKGSRK